MRRAPPGDLRFRSSRQSTATISVRAQHLQHPAAPRLVHVPFCARCSACDLPTSSRQIVLCSHPCIRRRGMNFYGIRLPELAVKLAPLVVVAFHGSGALDSAISITNYLQNSRLRASCPREVRLSLPCYMPTGNRQEYSKTDAMAHETPFLVPNGHKFRTHSPCGIRSVCLTYCFVISRRSQASEADPEADPCFWKP